MTYTPALVLLRHARTAANSDGRYMGRVDADACPSAISDAQPLRNAFEDRGVRAVFSSPLRRAAQTALVVSPGLPIKLDDRLQERALGAWEGLLKDEVRKRYPQAVLPNGLIDAAYTPPAGESLADFAARIRSFVTALVESADPSDGEIVLVTHNGWIRTAQYVYDGLPACSIYADPTPHLMPIRWRPSIPSIRTR